MLKLCDTNISLCDQVVEVEVCLKTYLVRVVVGGSNNSVGVVAAPEMVVEDPSFAVLG